MPKYLIQANYTLDGARGMVKDGASVRRAVVDKLVTSMGGKVEAFYYAFGDADLVLVADMPDNASVAATALAVNVSGAASTRTTVLLTVEEVDAATKRIPAYRAPGQA